MNNERITLAMKEQRINDILVKLLNGDISVSDTSFVRNYLLFIFIVFLSCISPIL